MEEKETTANKIVSRLLVSGLGPVGGGHAPGTGRLGGLGRHVVKGGGPVFRVDDVKVRWQFGKSNLTQIFVFFFPFSCSVLSLICPASPISHRQRGTNWIYCAREL